MTTVLPLTTQDPSDFIYGMTEVEFEDFKKKCPEGRYDVHISELMQQVTGCINMLEFRKQLTPQHPDLDPAQTMVKFVRIIHDRKRTVVQFNAILFDPKREYPWGVQVSRRLDRKARTVHSDLLKVHPALRRRGLGVLVSFQQEQLWQAAGYERIQITAGKDAGRTFWALMGYDFGPTTTPVGKALIHEALRQQVNEAVQLRKMSPELRNYILHSLDHDELRAWDIQLIADQEGKKIGVQAMAQSEWAGYKELNPQWPGNDIRDRTVRSRRS